MKHIKVVKMPCGYWHIDLYEITYQIDIEYSLLVEIIRVFQLAHVNSFSDVLILLNNEGDIIAKR